MSVRENALSDFCHRVPVKGISLVFVLALALSGLALWSGGGRAAPLWAPAPAIGTISITPAGDVPVGMPVLYTIPIRNRGDAANGVLTFTLPSQMSFVTATPGYAQDGQVLTWALTDFFANNYVDYTVTVQLEAGVILHDALVSNAKLALEGASSIPSKDATHYAQNAIIAKQSVTEIDAGTANALNEAVAGELVTATVYFTIPQGTQAYTVTPKVLLQDGLTPYASDPAWTAVYTGTEAALRAQEGRVAEDGVLVVFPNQGDLDATLITETVVVTVYARQLQTRPVAGTELANGGTESVQAVLRWCGAVACDLINDDTYFASDTTTNARITFVRPDMQFAFTADYLDADAVGAGGGQVRLTMDTENNNDPTGYDMVFTATLDAGMTYVTSSGEGTGAGTESAGPGGVTYVTWTVPGSLDFNQSWRAVITATLPSPFTIGQEFPYTATMQYETFAGAVVAEGLYQNTDAALLQPGISFEKTSDPASGYLTMGDRVTYTVLIKQGAHTILQSPICTDTLPLGFHYVSGTLSVMGATVVESRVAEGPVLVQSGVSEYFENLGWTMDTLPEIANNHWVTATFVTLNTGWDFRGKAVHELASDMRASRPTVPNGGYTGVTLQWTPPAGATYTMLDKVNSPSLNVIQPFMADNFATTRTGSGALEVGNQVILNISFRNNSPTPGIDAHEMLVCDTLPEGLTFAQDNGVLPSNLTRTPPEAGSSGAICWTFDAVPRGTLYTLAYIANVTPAIIPGYMTNHATIPDYTTQAGEVEGERYYSEVPAGLPTPVNCGDTCIQVLGLEVTKTPWVDMAEPGDLITYTLAYTDSSNNFSYTGVVITDTYDTYLIYRAATPEPAIVDADNHLLVWDIGAVADTHGDILLTLQVQNPLPDGVITLTNRMAWNSDQTDAPDRERVVVTPLDVANLMVDISGPETTYAADQFVYTVAYTNVGPTSRPVTLTFAYDPNLEFVSVTGDAAQWNGSDHIFTGSAPANTLRQMQVTVRVKAPLYYAVTELESMVELASAGATSKTDSMVVEVLRPQVAMFKASTAEFAPDSGQVIYTFTVRNTGNFTATGCVLTDTWEATKMSLFAEGSVQWSEANGNSAVWGQSPFSLTSGSTVTPGVLTLNVVSGADHYENLLDVTCDQIYGTPTFKHDLWKASIETYKVPGDVIAFPGRVLTYTLYYTNTGPVAQNVVITDHLPAGITLESYTQSAPNGCDDLTHGTQPGADGGTDIYWHCNFLSADSAGAVQVWGAVSGEEGTVITNTTASDADAPVPYRPGAVEVPLAISRPRLTLTQTLVVAHPEYNNVAPGDLILYELTYLNRGTALANEVVFQVHLPTDVVSFVSAPDGTEAGGIVTWDVGDVKAGRGGTVYVTVQAKAVPGQSVVFEAGDLEIASRRLNDAQPDDENEYFYPVEVTINDPDLSVAKSVSAPSLLPNALVTYTVALENVGGGTLTHVMFTDTLSTYLTLVSAPGCVHSGEQFGGILTCTVGALTQHVPTYTVQIIARLGTLPQGEVFYNIAWGYSDQTVSEASNPAPVGGDAPYNLLLEPTTQSGLPPYVAPQQVYFNLDASGSTPIDYVITFGNGASASGTLPSYGAVNTTYQMSGTYTVIMTATNQVGEATITYPITVTGAPDLQVTPLAVTENLLTGAQTSRMLTITNAAAATDILNWSLTESPAAGWLTTSVISGSLLPGSSHVVTLTFDAAGLELGRPYTTTLLIAGDGTPTPVAVKLNVLAPTLAWSPASLAQSAQEGSTAELTRTLTIQNTGAADLHWSIGAPPAATWLSVSISGEQVTAPAGQVIVIVSFNPTGLISNTYTANLQITSDDPLHLTETVPASFKITAHVEPPKNHIYLPLVLRNTQ